MKVVLKYLLVLIIAAIGLTQATDSEWEKAEITLKSDDQITDNVSLLRNIENFCLHLHDIVLTGLERLALIIAIDQTSLRRCTHT